MTDNLDLMPLIMDSAPWSDSISATNAPGTTSLLYASNFQHKFFKRFRLQIFYLVFERHQKPKGIFYCFTY